MDIRSSYEDREEFLPVWRFAKPDVEGYFSRQVEEIEVVREEGKKINCFISTRHRAVEFRFYYSSKNKKVVLGLHPDLTLNSLEWLLIFQRILEKIALKKTGTRVFVRARFEDHIIPEFKRTYAF